MPANPFLAMNRHLQRAFAHHEAIIWLRPGGPAEGHPLTGWFTEVSEEVSAEGFSMMTGKPKATLFVRDIIAIDPDRADLDPNEILRTNGTDRLSIGGQAYRVESCKADGLAKVELTLLET
jgi:hypothetical protein